MLLPLRSTWIFDISEDKHKVITLEGYAAGGLLDKNQNQRFESLHINPILGWLKMRGLAGQDCPLQKFAYESS